MESDQDRGSGHHSDSSFGHESNPDSNPGSKVDSAGGSGTDPDSSDEDGGDLTDMFRENRKDSSSSNPVATADLGRQKTRNDATYPLQTMLPIWTSWIRKRKNLNTRKLPPRAIQRQNLPRTRQPRKLGKNWSKSSGQRRKSKRDNPGQRNPRKRIRRTEGDSSRPGLL